MLITCPSQMVDHTLAHLKEAGKRDCECVVLWLGQRADDCVQIQQTYLPMQKAKSDMFWIPPDGMADLQRLLRSHRYMVAAQVHSHPAAAFHSLADDRWAIIRHENALSLVDRKSVV